MGGGVLHDTWYETTFSNSMLNLAGVTDVTARTEAVCAECMAILAAASPARDVMEAQQVLQLVCSKFIQALARMEDDLNTCRAALEPAVSILCPELDSATQGDYFERGCSLKPSQIRQMKEAYLKSGK